MQTRDGNALAMQRGAFIVLRYRQGFSSAECLSHWSHRRYSKPPPTERLLETVRFLKENTRRNNSYVRVCSSVALCSHGPSASCRVLSAWFDVVLLCCSLPHYEEVICILL